MRYSPFLISPGRQVNIIISTIFKEDQHLRLQPSATCKRVKLRSGNVFPALRLRSLGTCSLPFV